jgi:hypothetical protein
MLHPVWKIAKIFPKVEEVKTLRRRFAQMSADQKQNYH